MNRWEVALILAALVLVLGAVLISTTESGFDAMDWVIKWLTRLTT